MMDPQSFNHRTELLSTGRKYHFVDQIPTNYDSETTPTLLCVHGFPDLWYGWRFQIRPWQEKYRVVVPDMLGYGQTDMPSESDLYSAKRLSDDLAALLDLLGITKAVVIGHDWGSFVVSRFALWHPARLLGMILLSVPYYPPFPTYIPIEVFVGHYADFGYQLYFADKKSTEEIENHLSVFIPLLYNQIGNELKMTLEGNMRKLVLGDTKADVKADCFLDDSELRYYESQFRRGMIGPLSYYRNLKINQEEEKAAQLPSNISADLPVLLLYGTADPTCQAEVTQKSREFIPKLQIEALEGKGHWLMLEEKEFVATKVLEWLDAVLKVEVKL
jgi:pimeloyl-ACP methyl ester carboxylesterase